jgi:hypothetical protein
MKIYINNYRDNWLSPYTILEKVFFWREIDYDEPLIDKLSNFLLPFCTTLQKVLDVINPKINYIKIDRWDTWSMDHTLSYIILPMLKQLKETKHGAPFVDDEDVPEELKSTSAPPKENEWDTDGNHFVRWDYVLDEMIFAFEHKVDDSWEDNFRTGEIDMKFVKCEDNPELSTMVEGPKHTYVCDYEGMQKVHERMKNGFRLFGKYYEGLWD